MSDRESIITNGKLKGYTFKSLDGMELTESEAAAAWEMVDQFQDKGEGFADVLDAVFKASAEAIGIEGRIAPRFTVSSRWLANEAFGDSSQVRFVNDAMYSLSKMVAIIEHPDGEARIGLFQWDLMRQSGDGDCEFLVTIPDWEGFLDPSELVERFDEGAQP